MSADVKTQGYIIALIVGMVISGSANTLLLSHQLSSKAYGIDGTYHEFAHPWVQTLNMFIGEALCLLFYHLGQYRENRSQSNTTTTTTTDQFLRNKTLRFTTLHDNKENQNNLDVPLIAKEPKAIPDPIPFNRYLMILPATLDLLGTTLSGIGLIYVAASVWQMLRGSIILFTGILSRVVLKRVLLQYNYLGMFIVIGGLVLVGVAATIQSSGSGDTDAGKTVLGMSLVLLGMMVNAVQFIFEEMLLKDKNYPPLRVVGWEGIWGFLLCLFVFLPITYFIPAEETTDGSGAGVLGRYENSLDALWMMADNPVIMLYSILALFSISSYNFFGLNISKHVSSLTRAVLDSLRTIVIWAFEVILFYGTGSQNKPPQDQVGEEWTVYSWVQVAGFLILVTGTMTYSTVIKWPCITYPNQGTQDKDTVSDPESQHKEEGQ